MADEPQYEVNDKKGAAMDYNEHEATYSLFLVIVKWGIIGNVALLIALAVGFFMGGGIIGGLITFVVLVAAAGALF